MPNGFRHNPLDHAEIYRARRIKQAGQGFSVASVSVAADLKARAVAGRKAESERFNDQSANARFCELVRLRWREDRDSIIDRLRLELNPCDLIEEL